MGSVYAREATCTGIAAVVFAIGVTNFVDEPRAGGQPAAVDVGLSVARRVARELPQAASTASVRKNDAAARVGCGLQEPCGARTGNGNECC